ncbi:MAG: P-II family nitrogen regulator [Clostridiales bacterium]|nr:P-II family nitrogen regulator [Clostridiales bacterium]
MRRYGLILCIVDDGLGSKALKIAKKRGVKFGAVFLGVGTVKNKALELLGVNESKKEVAIMGADMRDAIAALDAVSEEMAFHKPRHGIGVLFHMADFAPRGENEIYGGDEVDRTSGVSYNAIFTIVDKGKGESVVDSASKAGSKGATIINARGSGLHKTNILFAIEIEPEKEIVLIIADSLLTKPILKAIREDMGIDEEGKGVMFVLDVKRAYGLYGK